MVSSGVNIIIPVAGEGTRLRPHTHATPKSLLYVAGKPILGHILDGLRRLDVERFSVVLGSQGQAVVDFCNCYPFEFTFALQEERLGLGHAVRLGAQGLEGATLVLLGDTITDVNYREFCSQRVNVLAVKEVSDPKHFGIVEVRGKSVIGLAEKPKHPRSNLAIVGLYYFQDIAKVSAAVDYLVRNDIRTKNEYQLTDALKHMLENGEKFETMKIEQWHDCGTAEALIATNRALLRKTKYYKKRPGNIIIGPVHIADSVQITESIIGPHVSIDEGVIVKQSVIKDSIINRGASVDSALLTESIVGANACVKGGYKRLNVSESSRIEIP